jgi:hypothetical protein
MTIKPPQKDVLAADVDVSGKLIGFRFGIFLIDPQFLCGGISDLKKGHIPDFGYEGVSADSMFGTEKKGWKLIADSILAYPKLQRSEHFLSKTQSNNNLFIDQVKTKLQREVKKNTSVKAESSARHSSKEILNLKIDKQFSMKFGTGSFI